MSGFFCYAKETVRLILNIPRNNVTKNNSFLSLGLCPNAPPKGFPNVYGGVCRIALWKSSGKNS